MPSAKVQTSCSRWDRQPSWDLLGKPGFAKHRRHSMQVVIVDAAKTIGSETSSRNSEGAGKGQQREHWRRAQRPTPEPARDQPEAGCMLDMLHAGTSLQHATCYFVYHASRSACVRACGRSCEAPAGGPGCLAGPDPCVPPSLHASPPPPVNPHAVVHAGIYYPSGYTKARLCVEGREALYAYCDAKGVPYKKVGKLVVATHNRCGPWRAAHADQCVHQAGRRARRRAPFAASVQCPGVSSSAARPPRPRRGP